MAPAVRLALRDAADRLLDDAQALQAAGGTATRPFTFAMSDVGEMVFLPKILERLRTLAPNAGIQSVSMPPHQIAEGLEKGEIDLTIGYFPDLVRQSF